jgi:hypothetical protein
MCRDRCAVSRVSNDSGTMVKKLPKTSSIVCNANLQPGEHRTMILISLRVGVQGLVPKNREVISWPDHCLSQL